MRPNQHHSIASESIQNETSVPLSGVWGLGLGLGFWVLGLGVGVRVSVSGSGC